MISAAVLGSKAEDWPPVGGAGEGLLREERVGLAEAELGEVPGEVDDAALNNQNNRNVKTTPPISPIRIRPGLFGDLLTPPIMVPTPQPARRRAITQDMAGGLLSRMATTRNPLVASLTSLRGNTRACVYTEPLWGLSMTLVIPYASVFMLALGLRDEQIGLLATLSALSQVVFGLLSGVIVDKLGRRRTTALFDLIAWVIPCLIWAVAQNFWYFLIASIVNGAWQVAHNAWGCLMVEDLEREKIPAVYSLVRVAGDVSALFAPIAAVLVAYLGLIPAVRILYLNAFVVMAAKAVSLYWLSTETRIGEIRRGSTRGVSIWRLLSGYRGLFPLVVRSRGTMFSMVLAVIIGAVALISNAFWQVVVSQRLGVPDPILPFFPMARSILSVAFFATVIPRLTRRNELKRPTLLGLASFLSAQLLLVGIPAGGAQPLSYVLLVVCLVLESLGGSLLYMLTEALIALHVDRDERSRVMAIQRTLILLLTAPFGWIAGLLSGTDRTWPFLLNAALLGIGLAITARYWVSTHSEPPPLH